MVAPAVGYAIYLGVGAAVAALMEACASSEPEIVCRPPGDPPPQPPTPDEYQLSDGQYSVIADKALSPKIAQFYLDKLPVVSQEILDLFDISSPFENGATIYLVNKTSKNNFCENDRGCTAGKMIGFPFKTTKSLEAGVQFNVSMIPLVHEMSHLLRQQTASPTPELEEGLAVYTEVSLTRNGSPAMQPLTATQIYNGPIKTGDTIPTPSAIFTNYIQLAGITKSGGLSFTLQQKSTETLYSTAAVNIGTPYIGIPGLALIVGGSVAGGLTLELYQRPTFESGKLFANLDAFADYICNEKGYREILIMRTAHGPITLSTTDKPYSIYHKGYSFVEENYDTNFCFWDTIRAKYGHSAVQKIVQKMSEYSKQHQAIPAAFSFYDTVKQVTGMSDPEAKTLFAMVGAPTANEDHSLGGVCWK